VALDGRVEARRRIFPGDRTAVRERSAQAALALLLGCLEGTP
jgi:nicotinamide mononucleotide (NMN) deamidase PncC